MSWLYSQGMQIVTRQGQRFEVQLRPAGGVWPVPPPYTVDGFLSTLLPDERRRLLTYLASQSAVPGVDPAMFRTRPTDPQVLRVLSGLLQRHAFACVAPGQGARPRGTGGAVAPGQGERSQPVETTTQSRRVEEVVCELIAAEASCSHKGRKANRAGLLEVVPGRDDDRIKLHADVRGGCGKHPLWEVRSPGNAENKVGVDSSFLAKNWGWKTLHIFEVVPKSYTVHVGCCTGLSRNFEIKAYPIDEWKVTVEVDFKKPPTQWVFDVEVAPWEETSLKLKSEIGQTLKDKKKQLEYALEKVFTPLVGPTDKWEFFKTKLIFSGKYVEHTDHRVFYQYSCQVKLDPLIKGTFTIPFGPTAAIPPWIKRWVTDYIGDFYLYIKFEGELSLAGKWAKKSPDAHEATVEGEGKLGLKVGGNLFLMKRGALNLDVNGGSALVLEAKAPVSKKPEVEFDLKCTGLEIELTIEAAWGMVEYKRKWKPIEGGSLFSQPKVWRPLGA